MKELREKADKYVFQAEVNRMMKLIINSLYRNKEVGVVNGGVTCCFYVTWSGWVSIGIRDC